MLRLAAWVALATTVAVLAVAASGGFDDGAFERWGALEAVLLAAVVAGVLRLGARLQWTTVAMSAVAAGAFASLGRAAISRWGFDALGVGGLVPNLCDHQLPVRAWIAAVALAAGAIAFVATFALRKPSAAVAIGAFSAPLIIWWTQTAAAYGCG